MTNSVGITGSVQVTATAVAGAGVSSSLSSGLTTPAASTSSGQTTATAATHNPRLLDDPSVGLITQFFSSNGGELITQSPSAAVVAYLRSGLTRDGASKAEAGTSKAVSA